ncbi:hypothetical protein [Arsenophonus nasoniae]|uniref:Uncharacterized protein n=1 Tax=Arsenophonus nasoniae TaxID=638 RepID=A0AA95GDF5_9GAMM|nr:hypothetical protein [Arsenophonus nasoniae]WGL94039.1 hypothetical protein QE207_01700 [Arsenophonus nasoniae]
MDLHKFLPHLNHGKGQYWSTLSGIVQLHKKRHIWCAGAAGLLLQFLG